MVDHIVDASERRGRVEIRVGVGRRRRWRAEDKGRIVAESYAAGAVVSEVARRHEITPQHLFAWRKAARAGGLSLPALAAEQAAHIRADHYGELRGRRSECACEQAWVDRDRDCRGHGSRGKRC